LLRLTQAKVAALAATLFMALYFIFHIFHFGYALPNTFYIKGASSFSLKTFLSYSALISPIFLGIFWLKRSTVVFFGLFLLAVVFQYSSSSLSMNYADRFAFHLFLPVAIFTLLVMSKSQGAVRIQLYNDDRRDYFFSRPNVLAFFSFIYVSLFALGTTNPSALVHIANYYPRALNSHAELGRVLNQLRTQDGVQSFSLGDAGMAAYHSRLINLDNIGLGSALVAHAQGVTREVVQQYDPDIIAFHARPDTGPRVSSSRHSALREFAELNGYMDVCHVYWKRDYTLNIFAREPYPQILELCSESQIINNIGDWEYFLGFNLTPPWQYWHE